MEKEFLEWYSRDKNGRVYPFYNTEAEKAYMAWAEGRKHAYTKAKKLLLAANNWVKITSNEDYTETIEKAFEILEDKSK